MKPSATSGVLTVLVVVLGGCATPFSSPATGPISPALPTPAGQHADSIRLEAESMIEAGAVAGSQHPYRSSYAHFQVGQENFTHAELFVNWSPSLPSVPRDAVARGRFNEVQHPVA